ncbi:hypothetical protein [Nocardioides pyridinolyticus]
MTYTPHKPRLAPDVADLQARIPGWGADRDPGDRPWVPRERSDPSLSGAHWEDPEEQSEKWPRERSVEHTQLPPVFGTTCPPTGPSGAVRKYAYATYSEGQAAHWLLLMAGDRIDTLENGLRSLFTLRPDNPITDTGVLAELKHHGFSSRFGHNRADVKHHWMDPFIVGAPWLIGLGIGYRLVSRARSRT